MPCHAHSSASVGGCAPGLAPSAVDESRKLCDFFTVTSLSTDRDGAVYVATMEARDYPITATQWHPVRALRAPPRGGDALVGQGGSCVRWSGPGPLRALAPRQGPPPHRLLLAQLQCCVFFLMR